jgi:two-component system CheB/CheR fusion protein
MSVFHYALRPGGFLLLGQTETVGASADLFSVADPAHRLYTKKSVKDPRALSFGEPADSHPLLRLRTPTPAPAPENALLQDARQLILSRYCPPGVIVDADLTIVETLGQTGPYLELSPGSASLSMFKMARRGLAHALRMAVNTARREGRAVRREGIRISEKDAATRHVNLVVSPLAEGPSEGFLLVLFEPVVPREEAPTPPRPKRARGKQENESTARIRTLEAELDATRQHMQAMIEDLEAGNEELQSANEEILSSNEELQSMNEELNTAREELQSTNEEINTVNEELHSRNDELTRVNSDLNNLLVSVESAVVIVGGDLCIRRFTPTAAKALNLIASDVGRPIHHINPDIDCPDLEERIRGVIDRVMPHRAEVRDSQGRWLELGIRPYKDVDNRINGAVLTLSGIAAQKQLESELRVERVFSEALGGNVNGWAVLLDDAGRVRWANESFQDAFGVESEGVLAKRLVEIDGGFDDPRVEALVERATSPSASGGDEIWLELRLGRPGRRRLALSARRLEDEAGDASVLFVARDTRSADEAGEGTPS